MWQRVFVRRHPLRCFKWEVGPDRPVLDVEHEPS